LLMSLSVVGVLCYISGTWAWLSVPILMGMCLLYLKMSDSLRLGRVFSRDTSKDPAVFLTPPQAASSAQVPRPHLVEFGDCMITMLGEQGSSSVKVWFKGELKRFSRFHLGESWGFSIFPEGHPPSDPNFGSQLLPLGSFWTREWSETVERLPPWKVWGKYFLTLQLFSLQLLKIAVQHTSWRRPRAKVAAVVLGMLPSGEVLITQRQSRVGGSYNSMWVFPGGHVDPGESVEEGALREFREETGLELDPSTMRAVALWQPYDAKGGKTFLMVCYTGTIAGQLSMAGAIYSLALQANEVARAAFVDPGLLLRRTDQLRCQADQSLPQIQALIPSMITSTDHASCIPGPEVPLEDIASGIGGGHEFALRVLLDKSA